jgi:hypothetical protein
MSEEPNVSANPVKKPFGRRHPVLKWSAISLLTLFVALVTVVAVLVHRAEPMLRARIVDGLERHFHARVELDSFQVSLFGGLRAEGKGLRIWPPAQVHGVTIPPGSDDKPLISIGEFRFRAPLHYKPGQPIRISGVQVEDVTVDMPPKSRFTRASDAAPGSSNSGNGGTDDANSGNGNTGDGNSGNESAGKEKVKLALIHFFVGSLNCANVHLILETSKPGKLPLEFSIASLRFTDIQSGGAMHFQADLTNARPVGIIHTSGTFGPWTVDDPGESAILGEYTFDHANLGDFKGIAGTLDSTGKYAGVLRDLTVDGVTDTPDFRLTNFGTPMNLHTVFHAHVDATNGDTWLQPVEATLGSSHFTVSGDIVRVPAGPQKPNADPASNPHPGGHDISLLLDIPHGRMEDFLRLTSKSGIPLMTGELTLKSTLEIPPGKEPVHERMKLKGQFTLDDAQFTSDKIQGRMAELSLRGQGDPKDAKDKNGASDIRGAIISNFTMERGVIALPNLKYSLPGADIDMAGTYGVRGGELNFSGDARMQATVSKMIGGWKGLLAKPIDRYFKKDGAGTEVPIHIAGTRESPQFSVDFGRFKKTSPQNPPQTHPENPAQAQPQSPAQNPAQAPAPAAAQKPSPSHSQAPNQAQ